MVDVTRSRYLRRKTPVVVGCCFMVFLLCNYLALISRLSIPSDSVHDRMTSVDSSFWLSSKIGMNYFNNAITATVTQTTTTTAGIATVVSSKKTTSTWKEILRNKTASSSRIGIHALRPEKNPATNIIVLGERHSGTTFFSKHLSDCFPNTSVRDTFVNNKHWIQHDPEHIFGVVSDDPSSVPSFWRDIVHRNDEMPGNHPPSNQSPNNNYFHNSFVVVLFRNPYDW
jgi:hypothetical protein